MGKSLDGSVVLSAQQHGSWEREQVAVRDLERRKFRSFHGERHPRSRDPKKIFILGHPDVEDAGLYNRSGRIATSLRGIRPAHYRTRPLFPYGNLDYFGTFLGLDDHIRCVQTLNLPEQVSCCAAFKCV